MLIAYDLLEYEGRDIRSEPFALRRSLPAGVVERVERPDRLILSPVVVAPTWEALALAHSLGEPVLVTGSLYLLADLEGSS